MLVAQSGSKVVLDLKVVFLSLLGQRLPNIILMSASLIINLFASSYIDKFIKILPTLRNMISCIEASVLAFWGVCEVIV